MTKEREALKLALEALENVQITGPDDDGLLWINLPGNGTTGKAILRVGKEGLIAAQCAKLFEADRSKAITAIREALAQPEQEPVATVESVATVVSESGNQEVTMSWWHEPALPVGTKLYTTPPQRKPLTDEKMFKIAEIAWRHGWASCRDAEYIGEEAEDERWGMVGAEVVQDIAAHGIGEKPDAA